MSRYAVPLILLLMLPAVCSAQQLSNNQLLNRGMAAFDKLPAYPGVKDAQEYADAVSYLFAYEQRLARAGDTPDQDFQQAFYWLYAHINDVKVGKGDQVERAKSNDDLRDSGIDAYNEAKSNKSYKNGRVWDIASYIRAQANLFTYQQVAGTGNNTVNSAYSWIKSAQLIQSGTKGDDPTNFASWRPTSKKPGSNSSNGPTLAADQVLTAQPIEYQIAEVKDWKKEYENQVEINEDLKSKNLRLTLNNRKLQEQTAALQEQIKQYEIQQSESAGNKPQADGQNYELVLNDAGESKIQVIKIIRGYTGKGLKESKELTEDLPKVVFESSDSAVVRKMAAKLNAAGALFELEKE